MKMNTSMNSEIKYKGPWWRKEEYFEKDSDFPKDKGPKYGPDGSLNPFSLTSEESWFSAWNTLRIIDHVYRCSSPFKTYNALKGTDDGEKVADRAPCQKLNPDIGNGE